MHFVHAACIGRTAASREHGTRNPTITSQMRYILQMLTKQQRVLNAVVGSTEYNCTAVLFWTGTVGTFENLNLLPVPRYFFLHCIRYVERYVFGKFNS